MSLIDYLVVKWPRKFVTLKVIHEGTSQVKEPRVNLLLHNMNCLK